MRTFRKLIPLLALTAALLGGCGDYEKNKILEAQNKDLMAQLTAQKGARLADQERLDAQVNMFVACSQWVDLCTKNMVIESEKAFDAGGHQTIDVFWLFWVKLVALGGLIAAVVGCAIGAARVWFAKADIPSQSVMDAAKQEIATAHETAASIIKTAQQVAHAEFETAKRDAAEARELVGQVKARQIELQKLDVAIKTSTTELEAIKAAVAKQNEIAAFAKSFKI